MNAHALSPSRHGSNHSLPLPYVMACAVFFVMAYGPPRGTECDGPVVPESDRGTWLGDMHDLVTLNVQESVPSGEPQVTAVNFEGVLREIPLVYGDRHPLLEWLVRERSSNPNLKVVIRADGSLDYRFLERVLVTCAAAEVSTVNFAVRRRVARGPGSQ